MPQGNFYDMRRKPYGMENSNTGFSWQFQAFIVISDAEGHNVSLYKTECLRAEFMKQYKCMGVYVYMSFLV